MQAVAAQSKRQETQQSQPEVIMAASKQKVETNNTLHSQSAPPKLDIIKKKLQKSVDRPSRGQKQKQSRQGKS